jgi:nucleotide-binding universal stress UspA family protein
MSPTLAFGDDRSAGADMCWDWIVSQHWEGWALEIVTAQPPVVLAPVGTRDGLLHPWEPEDPRRPAGRGFVSVEHLRAEMDPRVALITKQWDLVAIGARGRGVLKQLGLGSTADWLLREPTSPLVIARHPGPVERVLVAADGSADADRAVDCLAGLPWIRGVEVRVVVIEDGRVDPRTVHAAASDTLSGAGARPHGVTRSGHPASVLIEEIASTGPDLVVMGATGRSAISRLLLGSTTAAVAGSCACSILVVHAGRDLVP